MSINNNIILKTNFSDMKLLHRGKVRDIYDLDDKMLIISTDRVSAFDIVLPNGIDEKGKILTKLSNFWFEKTKNIVKNHLITVEVNEMPAICKKYSDILEGRSMLVHKAKPLPVECVVRGYITGSGFKEYIKTGKISGLKLTKGLIESDKLEIPIFTPTTKAEVGEHDESISFEKMTEIVGINTAEKLKEYTLKLYNFALEYGLKHGIIIADTKFEFGVLNNEIILIDEILTPDSSRFWYVKNYKPGASQNSMDKQIIRNYLENLDWNKSYPGPILPDNIVEKTKNRYQEITKIFTT